MRSGRGAAGLSTEPAANATTALGGGRTDPMAQPLFEVCVEGVDGALAAEAGGADRVELCASLLEGGLTPSLGAVREAVGRLRIPVHVIIRPRGGDFRYSDAEFATMLHDVALIRAEGAASVVIGCLHLDGTIDEPRTAELAAAARPLAVTFHRAFDMTPDPGAALDALVRLGVARVLTSGQRATALDGLELLRMLVARASGRIVVMACGALRPDNIGFVARAGLPELHFSALRQEDSPMRFRNTRLSMGGAAPAREYLRMVTDPDLVRATIAAARAA